MQTPGRKKHAKAEFTVANRHGNAHGATNVARIVKPPVRLQSKSVDYLRRFAAAALRGEVKGFAICAVGDDFATWYGFKTLSRQDRMTILGQLQMFDRRDRAGRRGKLVTDEKKIVEAKERFMAVCGRWAEGLIADGICSGRHAAHRDNHFTMPKTCYESVEHGERVIRIGYLPPAQVEVWMAAYQLIYDVRNATEYEPAQVRIEDFE